MIQTILFSYIVACFLLKDSQRQIIHPLTSMVVLYLFRIDQMIMETVFTQFLTEFTAQILVLMLKIGDSIPVLILAIFFCVFQSLGRNKMKSIVKGFSFVTFSVIFIAQFIFSFSPDEILLIDSTIIQIERLTRISIVDSCSGIYGLIIFLSSFIFFVNVTKTTRTITREQVILYGIIGMIGVYILNILRLLILINLSLYFPTEIWSEVHIYIGSIFIIGYLVIFWGAIWSTLPVRSST